MAMYVPEEGAGPLLHLRRSSTVLSSLEELCKAPRYHFRVNELRHLRWYCTTSFGALPSGVTLATFNMCAWFLMRVTLTSAAQESKSFNTDK